VGFIGGYLSWVGAATAAIVGIAFAALAFAGSITIVVATTNADVAGSFVAYICISRF
jgi:hypothetical protein